MQTIVDNSGNVMTGWLKNKMHCSLNEQLAIINRFYFSYIYVLITVLTKELP